MRSPLDRGRTAIVVALLGASAAGLAAGYALKAQCTGKVWDGIQFRRSCYSDVYALYFGRGIDRGLVPYQSTDIEYPAGTGLYIGLVGAATDTAEGFVVVNALGLALMGLGATSALAAMALDPRRVLLFALGPAVVLYGFHNWDLLAVGAATIALWAFWREEEWAAGLLLGIGAAFKLYPAFLVPALGLAAWRRNPRTAVWLGVAFVGGFVVLNLPVLLRSYDGWKYPWTFQSERGPNFETSWFFLQRHFSTGSRAWTTEYPQFVNWLSGAIFAGGSLLLLALEARRERVRPYALGFSIVALFLLTAKVFSPQYALWLLPFFAILSFPWWAYVAFAVTDAAVWFAVSSFFLALGFNGGDTDIRLLVLEILVWARYAVLLGLIILALRTKELVRDPPPRPEPAPVALTA